MGIKWIFDIPMTPKPKPVMTYQGKRSDRALRYFAYCNELKLRAGRFDPKDKAICLRIDYYLPMPKSYSKKKRAELDGMPHTQKPDLSNLSKAFEDAIIIGCDSKISCHIAFKYWTSEKVGRIVGYFEDL